MNRCRRYLSALTVALCACCCAAVPAAFADRTDTDAVDRLPADKAIPALTQQLMNALPGDAAVWQHYLSEHAIYVSETGEVATKQELLQGFKAFPEGLKGSIELKSISVMPYGDIAISTFIANERQTVYDQTIAVDYRATHTWSRESGSWRLIAAQNVVMARNPKPLPIDLRNLDEYSGTYEMSGKRRYRVQRRGDGLIGGREGSELAPLIAVGDNVFADSSSALGVLRIFVRGASGAVERMVQRRKFADIDWIKVVPARADRSSK